MTRSSGHDAGSGSSEIQALGTFKLNGHEILTIHWHGRECWLAWQLNNVYEYSEGQLVRMIRREWSNEFIQGKHYEILEGENLKNFRACVSAFYAPAKAQSLLILFESGLDLIRLKSQKPVGVQLRQKLAEEVLPSLRRTGRYEVTGSYPIEVLEPDEDQDDHHLVLMQHMLDEIKEGRRTQRKLAAEQARLARESEETQSRVSAIESMAHARPIGIGLVQLAHEIRWNSESGIPHNTALLLVLLNSGYAEDGRLYRQNEYTALGIGRPAWYLTAKGAADFYRDILPRYEHSVSFVVEPGDLAKKHGQHTKKYVHVAKKSAG